MYIPGRRRFRQDLIITAAHNKSPGPEESGVWVKDPKTGKLFKLEAEEYFLCIAMDGIASSEVIIACFEDYFHHSISIDAFLAFTEQICKLGLLEDFQESIPVFVPASGATPTEATKQTSRAPSTRPPIDRISSIRSHTNNIRATDQKDSIARRQDAQKKPELSIWLWTAKNPNALLRRFARLLSPLLGGIKLVGISLIIIFPVAFFTMARHLPWLMHDLRSFVLGHIPNLVIILLGQGVQASLAKLGSGIVASSHGNFVKKMGFGIFLGILPRPLLALSSRRMSRQQQIEVYGSSLAIRIFLFSLATFIWYGSHGRTNAMTPLALVIMMHTLFGLLLDGIPLWPSDGYYLLIAQFGISDIFRRSFQIWTMVLQGQPFPRSLSNKERLGLQAMGAIGTIAMISIILFLIYFVSSGLAQDFATSILGNAANFILFSGMAIIFAYKLLEIWSTMKGSINPPVPHAKVGKNDQQTENRNETDSTKSFIYNFFTKPNVLRTGAVLGALIIMFVPYRLRPGGQITILPQKEQKIQIPFTGELIKVISLDNSDKLLPAGTAIATIDSPDLDNRFQVTKEQIIGQNEAIAGLVAKLEKAMLNYQSYSNLAKLSATKYSRRVELYAQGAVSLQDMEDAARLATTDENNVKTQSKIIEEVSHDLENAKSELAKLRQNERYLRSEIQKTILRMPFDGYLSTAQLDRKVGTFLNQGDTFAIAKVNERGFLGEILVPESETDQVLIGRPVEIKLFAFPLKSIKGRVISVGQVAVTSDTTGTTSTSADTGQDIQMVQETAGKVIKVIVIFSAKPDSLLRAGMTGRAKIEGQSVPLVVAFSRSLYRFVTIEMWSWLP